MTTTYRTVAAVIAGLAGFACVFNIYPVITGAVAFAAGIQVVRSLRKDAK